MSSVDSAGGGGGNPRAEANDEIRRLREEYRKKEADLVKKQNKEIARMNEAHETEMEKLETQQSHDLGDNREKTKEVITQRDAKFQKEIENMRALQTKQLERLSQENAQKVESQRAASTSEVSDEKVAKADREKDLLRKYEEGNREQGDKFSTQLGQLRDDERDTLVQQKKDLNDAHQKELTGVREDRNERVADLESKNREMYEDTTRRLKDQQVGHIRDMQRIQDSDMATLKRDQVSEGRLLENERQGYQDGLRRTKAEFANKRESDMAMSDSARNKFHDDVNGRIDGQVNRLQHELAQANDRGITAETAARAGARREIDDTRDAYQTKVDGLEHDRQATLDQTNDRISKKVKVVHDETDKQMATNSRYYIGQMELENSKDTQARGQMRQDFSARQKYLEDQSNTRINKVRGESITAENELKDSFQSDIDMQKTGYEDKKKDLIYKFQKDNNDSISRLHDRAEKEQVDHSNQLNVTTDKFEKRIAELNDQLVRERRLADKHSHSVVKDLTRERENDIENLKVKYEEREKAMQVAHQQEMNEMNRRQQEKLDDILTTMRKQT